MTTPPAPAGFAIPDVAHVHDPKTTASLPAMFFAQAKVLAERPLAWHRAEGRWHPWTWADIARKARALASTLRNLGLERGDRVILLSENRPEWLISDVAIMAAGGVTVPAYITHTEDDHQHLLTDSGARFAIASTGELARPMLAAATSESVELSVIVMDRTSHRQDSGVHLHAWDAATTCEGLTDDQIAPLGRGDLACLIYTSGTGGAPKGVMLSHGNILADLWGCLPVLEGLGLGHEVFLSFLPLSHAYEHTVGLWLPVCIGAEICYAESLEKLTGNIAETRPTLMTAVPRLYEVMRGKILAGVARKGGVSAKLFDRAADIGSRRWLDPDSLTFADRLIDPLLDVLVRRKVKARFGGRLKAFVSGGAPLNPEVGAFFLGLGVPLHQGYGQTENGPVASVNPFGAIKLRTVGPPLRGIEWKIAEDGEILMRGEVVMQGYWKRPEDTARTVDAEGWLHTGDIGVLDEDNYLTITDRKKDMIVNSGGDNISPQRVEGFLCLEPEIGQAMVYGDKRPHLVALVVPDPAWLETWAAEHGKPAELGADLAEDADLRRALAAAVDRVNKRLSSIEKVRRFAVPVEPFSIANGQLTPTLKVRRHIVKELYHERLEALYGGTA